MTPRSKLILIKSLHTLIWIFFNVVIFYVLYAAIINKIDKWVWICIAFVIGEGIVLAANKTKCPLTHVAEKYTDAREPNFDIYLPLWLAQYNKIIYTTIFGIGLLLLLYRLLWPSSGFI